MESSSVPSTPPHRRISRPRASPITPPLRTSSELRQTNRSPKAGPVLDSMMEGARRGRGFLRGRSRGQRGRGGRRGKQGLSVGGFAKMNLFAASNRDDLKPLRQEVAARRARGRGRGRAGRAASRGRGQQLRSQEESDTESGLDEDPFFDTTDSEEGLPIKNTTQDISQDPNFNPDLSDSEMSRSPSPLPNIDLSYSQPISTALQSHPSNVPSANPALYFQKIIPTHHAITICKPGTNGEQRMRTPMAYWKWPSGKEVVLARLEEANRKAARAETRNGEFEAIGSEKRAVEEESQTMTNVPIRVQRSPNPPHINWIRRATDVAHKLRREEEQIEERKQELEMLKKQHAELIKGNRDEALRAVASGVVIDEEDGFIRVKGTRKRVCAGMDLDIGRVRRKYIWKSGKAPLRGKKKTEHDARVAAEQAARAEDRANRRAAGLPVTDTEEEVPPSPKLKTRKKRATSKKKRKKPTDNQDGDDGTVSGSEASVQIRRKTKPAPRKARVIRRFIRQIDIEESESDEDGPVKTPPIKRKRVAPRPATITDQAGFDDGNETKDDNEPVVAILKKKFTPRLRITSTNASVTGHGGQEPSEDSEPVVSIRRKTSRSQRTSQSVGTGNGRGNDEREDPSAVTLRSESSVSTLTTTRAVPSVETPALNATKQPVQSTDSLQAD